MSKVFCVETNRFQEQDDLKKYTVTGETRVRNGIRCAVLKREGFAYTYLKPWDQIVNLKVRGERNVSAKLNTQQVRSIVKEAYESSRNDLTFKAMGEKYGVSAETISGIANGHTWRHITVGLISQLKSGNKEVLNSVVSASNYNRHKTNKLNPSLARFMVREHYLNRLSVKILSEKYLVSETTVRRVLAGKVWKDATMPAIVEYSKWR